MTNMTCRLMCLLVFMFIVHMMKHGLKELREQHLKEDIRRLIEDLPTSRKSPRQKTIRAKVKRLDDLKMGRFWVHRTSPVVHQTLGQTECTESTQFAPVLAGARDRSGGASGESSTQIHIHSTS